MQIENEIMTLFFITFSSMVVNGCYEHEPTKFTLIFRPKSPIKVARFFFSSLVGSNNNHHHFGRQTSSWLQSIYVHPFRLPRNAIKRIVFLSFRLFFSASCGKEDNMQRRGCFNNRLWLRLHLCVWKDPNHLTLASLPNLREGVNRKGVFEFQQKTRPYLILVPFQKD